MKFSPLLFFAVFTLLACDKIKKKDSDHVPVHATDEDTTPGFDSYSSKLQEFVAEPNATFRGAALGYTMAEVRGVEKAKHRESGDDYIIYEIASLPEYSAEVEYRFKNEKLNEIEALAFFDDALLRDDFYNELVSYYDQLTDVSKVQQGVTTSIELDKSYVLIEKTGTEKRPDLRLHITPKM